MQQQQAVCSEEALFFIFIFSLSSVLRPLLPALLIYYFRCVLCYLYRVLVIESRKLCWPPLCWVSSRGIYHRHLDNSW